MLPAVVATLTLAIGALGLQVERIRMVTQASEAARSVARGELLTSGESFERDGLICVELRQPTAFGFELVESGCAKPQGV